MARSFEGICQLCGTWGLLTDDHIPQKSLYPKQYRSKISKFNTIKACSYCNNGSSVEDEVLKVLVGSLAHLHWGVEMWNSILSTLEGNKKLDRDIESNSRYEDIPSGDGVIESAKILKLDGRLKGMFLLAMERIAKGLFYQEFSEVLTVGRNISTFHPDALHQGDIEYIQKSHKMNLWKSVNNETCIYLFDVKQNGRILLHLSLFNTIKIHYVIQKNAT